MSVCVYVHISPYTCVNLNLFEYVKYFVLHFMYKKH